MMSNKDRVLVAGAGPVGFTMALNLVRRGIPVTMLEGADKIFDDPRAGTIHPPTLEMFADLGVTDKMLAQGYSTARYHYRDRREGLIADFDLGVLRDETPYPMRLMLEQHKICYILRDMLLGDANFEILMQHRITKVEQDSDGVRATVDTPDGERTFEGLWMIGCDGGRSQIRKSMDVTFGGFTYPERFLVLSTPYDFGAFGYAITNYIADPDEWCALFKVPGLNGQGMWRVVFPVSTEASVEEVFAEDAVQARIQGFHPKAGDYDVVHRNLYDVHQRIASSYVDGRLLVAGDAAHINNPLGGMGMNFGFHDAFNLADKLGKIWFDGASRDLLDLYDRQRRTVAEEYLRRQTMENKKNLEQKDPSARERFYDELRDIVADRAKLHAYLKRVTMIEGIQHANSIQ